MSCKWEEWGNITWLLHKFKSSLPSCVLLKLCHGPLCVGEGLLNWDCGTCVCEMQMFSWIAERSAFKMCSFHLTVVITVDTSTNCDTALEKRLLEEYHLQLEEMCSYRSQGSKDRAEHRKKTDESTKSWIPHHSLYLYTYSHEWFHHLSS